METKSNAAYPLRMRKETRELVEIEALHSRRSLNAELGLLIEEGLKWREAQKTKVGT